MHYTLRHALAVELRELFDQVVIGEDDCAVSTDGAGMGI
jgi:hypothetical protein